MKTLSLGLLLLQALKTTDAQGTLPNSQPGSNGGVLPSRPNGGAPPTTPNQNNGLPVNLPVIAVNQNPNGPQPQGGVRPQPGGPLLGVGGQIQAGPAGPAGPLIGAGGQIQAGPAGPAGPLLGAGGQIQAGPAGPAGPLLGAGGQIQAGPAGPGGPLIGAGGQIQVGPAGPAANEPQPQPGQVGPGSQAPNGQGFPPGSNGPASPNGQPGRIPIPINTGGRPGQQNSQGRPDVKGVKNSRPDNDRRPDRDGPPRSPWGSQYPDDEDDDWSPDDQQKKGPKKSKGTGPYDPCAVCEYDDDDDDEDDGDDHRRLFNFDDLHDRVARGIKRSPRPQGQVQPQAKGNGGGLSGFVFPQPKGKIQRPSNADPGDGFGSPGGGFDDHNNDRDDDDDNDNQNPWFVKKSKKSKSGKPRCPPWCKHRPHRSSSSSTKYASTTTSTTSTYEPIYTSTSSEIYPTTTEYYTTTTTTTLETSTRSRHPRPPYTDTDVPHPTYTLPPINQFCPATCYPPNSLNTCDVSAGCASAGGSKYYCVCPAGFRATGYVPSDFTHQFKVPGLPYVYVAPGVQCGTPCGPYDQDCSGSGVLTRAQCV